MILNLISAPDSDFCFPYLTITLLQISDFLELGYVHILHLSLVILYKEYL